jgi:hypothetical protein
MSAGKPWSWVAAVAVDPPELQLIDGAGRVRASVWTGSHTATWHTYDIDGTGGENDSTAGYRATDDAKRCAVASIVRQGWAPGGWKVTW